MALLEVVICPSKEIYLQLDNIKFRVGDWIEYCPEHSELLHWYVGEIANISFVEKSSKVRSIVILVRLKNGSSVTLKITDQIRHFRKSIHPDHYFTVVGYLTKMTPFYFHFCAENEIQAKGLIEWLYLDKSYLVFKGQLQHLGQSSPDFAPDKSQSFYYQVKELSEYESNRHKGDESRLTAQQLKRMEIFSRYLKWCESIGLIPPPGE